MDRLDEPSEEEPLTDVPLAERRLVTQAYDMSVTTLVEQWNDQTLVLPEIQREYVWRNTKASRLIESLLLNVPIPVIYFAEAPGDQYEVIDGHQRIRSIARFMHNDFRLSGLQVLASDDYRGRRFNRLSAADQRRIRTRVIRAIIITEESHSTMKYEVFERLNAGATALTAQEIRNSSYRGPFMTRVRQDWVNNVDFRAAVGTAKPRSRMVDEELIIRALALRDRLEEYRPPLPRFLNRFSADMNGKTEKGLDDLGEVFARAAKNVFSVFGQHAFQLTNEHGEPIERNFNRGLAETQLVTLSHADPAEVAAKSQDLLHVLGRLHRDTTFLDFIQRAIVDRSRTIGRMTAYREACASAGLKLNQS